jgi:formamidopyrimidine-DNA glycosylase
LEGKGQMIELPEANSLARQLNETVKGRRIVSAEAGHSPHKFAWYTGDAAGYGVLLGGHTLLEAKASGGVVELAMDSGLTLFLSDGVNLRWHKPGSKPPEKHQLLLMLDDGSALTVTIQMYGGIACYPDNALDNYHLTSSRAKTSPLSSEFNREYFDGLLQQEQQRALSAKAFLATEQRVPGLGNGVLQDILFKVEVNPRRKMDTLSSADTDALFDSLKSTLMEMTAKGGRDTETDLFGLPGGYSSILSRNTVGTACPRCGETIVKEAYMGGSIYYCPGCQKK